MLKIYIYYIIKAQKMHIKLIITACRNVFLKTWRHNWEIKGVLLKMRRLERVENSLEYWRKVLKKTSKVLNFTVLQLNNMFESSLLQLSVLVVLCCFGNLWHACCQSILVYHRSSCGLPVCTRRSNTQKLAVVAAATEGKTCRQSVTIPDPQSLP